MSDTVNAEVVKTNEYSPKAQTDKKPATRDEIATAYELGDKPCTWLVYYRVWRVAERYHGIAEDTK